VAINIPIVSQYNDKGVKDANKSLGGFDKTVRALGKSLVGVFAAKQAATFFASSIKGAMDDQRAQVQLEKSIRNTTNATSQQINGLRSFIQTTQFSTGVLDDQLRPALNRLVLSTGDVEKSQKLLTLALDISAGTGKDLESVTTALSKAAGGQFTALQRLGVGLDKSTLATKDLDQITGALSTKFSGQAAAATQTFGGQVQLLNAYFQEAKETIGFAFIQAIESVVGQGGAADQIGKALVNIAEEIGYVIIGTITLTDRMYDLGNSFVDAAKKAGLLPEGFGLADLIPLIPILGSYITITRETGKEVAALAETNKNAGDRYQLMAEKLYGFKSTADNTIPTIEKATKATKGLSDAQKAVINANIKLQDSIVNNLQTSLSSAENSLDAVTNKFDDLRDTIAGSVTEIVDFGAAVETGNFIEAITKQAQDATSFADKVKQLIVLGLSERGIRELLSAGYEAGSLIADQLIAGGATVVSQINTLLDSVNTVAETVGVLGAETFYQQGVTQGQALVAGIKASLEAAKGELDKLRQSLTAPSTKAGAAETADNAPSPTPTPTYKTPPPAQLTQMEKIIKAAGGAQSTAASRSYTAMAAAMGKIRLAKGGIVTGPTNALIGEAGPEAVIPLTGANSVGMGSTFNITVNAGIGTDGAVVGRQIVDAIRKYERSSGQVFARV
jgi:hypothetical protein